jgi:hypothetical protein
MRLVIALRIISRGRRAARERAVLGTGLLAAEELSIQSTKLMREAYVPVRSRCGL